MVRPRRTTAGAAVLIVGLRMAEALAVLLRRAGAVE